MPTWEAIAAAVRRLSPVIMATSRPIATRSATAAAAPPLSVSATASTPRACAVPAGEDDRAAQAFQPVGMPRRNSEGRPCPTHRGDGGGRRTTATESTVARTPAPGTASKAVAVAAGRGRARGRRRRSPARPGAPSRPRPRRPRPAAGRRPRRPPGPRRSMPSPRSSACPSCRTRRCRRRLDRSSTSPPLISTPRAAPRPVPTMIAVGVARPRAHGQAMISTATAASRPAPGSPAKSDPAGEGEQRHHQDDRNEHPRDPVGQALHRGLRALRLLDQAHDLRQRGVGAHRGGPHGEHALGLTVAAATSSPGPLSTGTDSPVSIDSSTAEVPSTTTPSTGTFSPGRTRTRRRPAPARRAPGAAPAGRQGRPGDASLAPSSSRARDGPRGPALGPRLHPPSEREEGDDQGGMSK